MRVLRLVLGLLLISAALNGAFRAGAGAGSDRVAFAFVLTIFLAEVVALPRRIAMITLSLTALVAAPAALTISMLTDGDPSPEFPWMSRFYFGVFVAALLLAPTAFWKAIRPELFQESAQEPASFDPFDPVEPPDEMIEPDPVPTLGALLARKRSLNLARAR